MSENELPRNAEGNVTDADLIRYLDGEVTLATRASLSALIAERADLAARVEQLRHRSARLSSLLAGVSPAATQVHDSATAMRPRVLRSAAHPSWWLRAPAGLKAAAAIALLFSVVLVVPEARAWVIARARNVAAAFGLVSQAPAPPAPAAPLAAPVPPVSYAFAVDSDTIDIDAQVTGVLIVRRGTGAQAFVETSAPDTRFTVRTSWLRIEGPPAVDASYELTVPQRVTAVRVRSADGKVMTVTVPTDAQELRIDLTN